MLDQVKEVFRRKFEQRAQGSHRRVGLEVEFPLVTATGEAISSGLVEKLLIHLSREGFRLLRDPTTGAAIGAEMLVSQAEEDRPPAVDHVEMELGFCTLELSLAPEETLFGVERRLTQIMRRIVDFLREHGGFVLGYGIQPLAEPGRWLQAPKGRYDTYTRVSPNRVVPRDAGKDIHLFGLTAANHCHMDVSSEEAIRQVNVMNGLAGLQIALCVNSPIWRGAEDQRWSSAREMFYDLGMSNWSNRIGIPQRFDNISQYIEIICSLAPLMIKRRKEYLAVPGYATTSEFFAEAEDAWAERASGERVAVTPVAADIVLFSNLWWHMARLAPAYGTLEARAFCAQPPGEALAPPALALGTMEQLDEAEDLLRRAPWCEWVALRTDAASRGLGARLGGAPVLPLVADLLKLAEAGLRRRGLGEEQYLAPLWHRLKARRTPADQAKEYFRKNGIHGLVGKLAHV